MGFHQFSLTWNTDYGVDSRWGWTVCMNGRVVVQFERFAIVALVKAYWTWWRWHYD